MFFLLTLTLAMCFTPDEELGAAFFDDVPGETVDVATAAIPGLSYKTECMHRLRTAAQSGPVRLSFFPVLDESAKEADRQWARWPEVSGYVARELEWLMARNYRVPNVKVALTINKTWFGKELPPGRSWQQFSYYKEQSPQCGQECVGVYDGFLPDDGVSPHLCLFYNMKFMGTGQGSSREAISGRDMRVALHELSHVSFGAHHDKCLDPQSGIMMEYGNPFSVMGRAWSQNAVSQVPGSRRVDLGYQTTDFHPDNFAIQGLSQLFAGQLYPSTRIVDVAQDGEEVTVGAFDVLPTLLDDSVTLAARVSLDVADPEFYVMVSVRALADEATAWPNRELHPSHAHLQPNELPPAGHVEVTMHSRYLRRGKSIGFSETAQLLDTTPGSTFLNLTQSHPEVAGSNAACIDGAMYPGSQFWFDPLDLLIEVRSVVPIAQPFPRDSAAMFPGRSEWMYSIAEQPTATVGFYRISSLEERRAADCGNGVRDATEQCDGGTGCANCFCDKEAGFAPVFGSTTALGCVQSCGDGEVRGREECDPADETVTAEERARCGTDCTCKEGFGTEWVGANFHPGHKHNTCKPGSSKPKALATCGDGEVSALDECDGSEYCNERCECTTRPKFVFNPALLDEKAAKGALSGSALYSPLTLDGCVDWMTTTGSDLSWSSRLVLPEYTSGVFREAVDGEGESGLSTTTIIGLVAGALVCLAACTTIAAIAVAAVVRARRPVRSATPTLVQGSRRRSVRASRPQSGRVRAGSIAWH